MLVESGFLSFGICNSMQLKESRTLLMNRIRNPSNDKNPENQSIYQINHLDLTGPKDGNSWLVEELLFKARPKSEIKTCAIMCLSI